MMPPEFDLGQLPPQVRERVEAQRRAGEEFQAAHQAEMERTARLMLFWAPISCTCTRWYDWTEPSAPQDHCPLHGQLLVRDDGSAVLWQ